MNANSSNRLRGRSYSSKTHNVPSDKLGKATVDTVERNRLLETISDFEERMKNLGFRFQSNSNEIPGRREGFAERFKRVEIDTIISFLEKKLLEQDNIYKTSADEHRSSSGGYGATFDKPSSFHLNQTISGDKLSKIKNLLNQIEHNNSKGSFKSRNASYYDNLSSVFSSGINKCYAVTSSCLSSAVSYMGSSLSYLAGSLANKTENNQSKNPPQNTPLKNNWRARNERKIKNDMRTKRNGIFGYLLGEENSSTRDLHPLGSPQPPFNDSLSQSLRTNSRSPSSGDSSRSRSRNDSPSSGDSSRSRSRNDSPSSGDSSRSQSLRGYRPDAMEIHETFRRNSSSFTSRVRSNNSDSSIRSR